jgi:hypothetical protein
MGVVCFVLVAMNSPLLPNATSGVAEAANPRENGLVAYVESVPMGSLGRSFAEIYTIAPDDSDRRRLTFDGGVFVKDMVDYEGSPYKLYTWNAAPEWTPDGLTLAYFHYSVDDQVDIRLIDPTTGDIRVLFSDWHGSMISWSPDGRRIAYGDEKGVWIADADGSNATLIAASRVGLFPFLDDSVANVVSVEWSPDGAHVAFVEHSGKGLVAGFRYLSAVAVDPPYGRVALTGGMDRAEYDWAPDGFSLAVVGYYDERNAGVYEFKFDGSGPDVLIDEWAEELVWSPDGTEILYTSIGLMSYDIVQESTSLLVPEFSGRSLAWQPIRRIPHPVGLVDPTSGIWRTPDGDGLVRSFFYGNPGDVPFRGDWDCDGIDTPGLFRTSDAFAYLRNSNSQGIADIRFFFGNPSDIPLAGDFNGDGCDTVSIYRPSEARFYIVNELGENEGGLGAADYSFLFGNQGDKPVVGDWDGDGLDEIGLHRETTGLFYYRNMLTTGVADGQFFFGDPGDRFVAGDWGVIDGADTPAVFRPSTSTFYFRYTLTQGNADSQFTWVTAEPNWLPVSGS